MVIKGIEQKGLLYKDLAYKIVGCFYSVYNELGPGYKESIYHKALSIEFKNNKIGFMEEKQVSIIYQDKKVGAYIPDFIVEDKIIIELKAVDFMPKVYEGQLYSYLKGTKYKLGYLVNFGGDKIDIRRRIYDSARKYISANQRL
ncbi:MAG: GxxExxY protein [Candidatus Omnitrophota bacterium]